MAEDDSAQEKSEEPTSKRQDKAREEGQIPRSKDFTTTAVLVTSTIGLFWFGGVIAEGLLRILRFNFTPSRESIFDTDKMLQHLGYSFAEVLMCLLPFFSCVALAAIVGPTALGGVLFSSKSLGPKFNRMNPISGLKRMFSLNSLVELFKGIGKVLLLMGVAYALLQHNKVELLNLSSESLEAGIQHSLELSLWAAIFLSTSTLIIAAIDIPFQIWDHTKKLRMSKQDIKDELKDSEGKPEVKGKIRQMQMQLAQNRMMASVPEADVIITNPTHYSIALKYNPESMSAPILLAKGIDHQAMRIRKVAKEHKIDFIESPALARSIYYTTEVEEEVPEGLYVAVAQILAYIFQLREFRKGKAGKPDRPRSPQIPKDMRY